VEKYQRRVAGSTDRGKCKETMEIDEKGIEENKVRKKIKIKRRKGEYD